MNDREFENIKVFIRRVFADCGYKLYLEYILGEKYLKISDCDDYIIRSYDRISFTNFQKILSMINTHELFSYYRSSGDIEIKILSR